MTSFAKHKSQAIKTLRDGLTTTSHNDVNDALVNRIVEIREEIHNLLKIIKALKH